MACVAVSVPRLLKGLALAAVVAAPGAPAYAHHSSAMYDFSKPIQFAGTVKAWKWTNPHSFLHIEAPAEGGREAKTWLVEFGSPNSLFRSGMRPSSMNPGEKVSVTIVPLRDGGAGGQIRELTLADGEVRKFGGVAR